jgi:hypothetical protein
VRRPGGDLIYVNSGTDQVLALNLDGTVIRSSDPDARLDPGGAVLGPDGRFYLSSRRLRTVMALPTALDRPAVAVIPAGAVPFPRGFGFSDRGCCPSRPMPDRA